MARISKHEISYLEHRRMLQADPVGNQIVEVAAVLNSKTSALLTHVSIMMAVSIGLLAFLQADKSGNKLIADVLFGEVIAYLMISILCLFAISMSGWRERTLDLEGLIARRSRLLTRRRACYRWALVATVLTTLILICVLGLEVAIMSNLLGLKAL